MAALKCSFGPEMLMCMDQSKIKALYELDPKDFRQRLRRDHYKKEGIVPDDGDAYTRAAPLNAKAIFDHGQKRMLRRDLSVGHIVALVEFASQWKLIDSSVSQELKDYFSGKKYNPEMSDIDQNLCNYVYGVLDCVSKNKLSKDLQYFPDPLK